MTYLCVWGNIEEERDRKDHFQDVHGFQEHQIYMVSRASLVAQLVENPPVMQETQETGVRSLGREDTLEKEMAAHSSIPAWRIPWTEEPLRSH